MSAKASTIINNNGNNNSDLLDVQPNDVQKKIRPIEFLFKKFTIQAPKAGDIAEGLVVSQRGPRLFIDIGPFGAGIVYGREFYAAKEIIKKLKPGDSVSAKIMQLENEEGYVELSLQAAGKELVWREAEELQKDSKPVELKVADANKGGLVLEWKGVQGFLPSSQLKSSHYPRVEGGDKEKIFEELKKFVGNVLTVTILVVDPKEGKIIFSEKSAETEEIKEAIAKYKVGDVLEGDVTGVVDFGVFVRIGEGIEGLVHISELDWSLVENPANLFKIGDKVKVKIIGIEGRKISLSVKALKPDPWIASKDKYHKGDIVEGVVIRLNKYGALVSVEEGVSGLNHVSEFGSEKEMRSRLEIGKTYPFQILVFEPEKHNLTFSYLGEENKKAKPESLEPDNSKTEDFKKES